MNSYVITGAKRTGGDVRIELEAGTEAEARAAAIQEGILITECMAVGPDKPVGNRTEIYLREIAMWLRFFGVTMALVVFVVILKTVISK